MTTQQPVLLVGRADQRYLDLYRDVADAHRLHVGARVLYTLDAYPKSIFTARVIWNVAAQSDRMLTMADGQIINEERKH